MKLLAFLMASLVLTLSCFPCMDSKETDLSSPGIGYSVTHPSSEHQQDDACSPFCTCTCCAGFSINYDIAAISHAALYRSREYILNNISAVIEISLPIWQPPQLS